MEYLLIFLGFVLVVFISGAINSAGKEDIPRQSNKQPVPPSVWNKPHEIIIEETPDPEGEPLSKFSCGIAGIKHHEVSVSLGGFVGYAAPEPQNEYDSNAIAIYNKEYMIIGYVPKKAQPEYLEYFQDRVPCYIVGYADRTTDGNLSGKAYFIRVQSWEYARYELVSLCNWMKKKKGIEVIDGYEEMLHQIDARIAEKRAKENEKMIPK